MKSIQADAQVAVKEAEGQSVFKFGYNASLDGIRGISILAVMIYNARMGLAEGAFIGVTLFFVLSGFLITMLLVQEHDRSAKISLKSFYYRRALRLLPALVLLLLFCCAYAAILQPGEKAVRTYNGAFYALFYVLNWAQVESQTSSIGALSHAWSLSVEEQFYLVWPLLLSGMLSIGMKRKAIASFIFALISISIIWSAYLWRETGDFLRPYVGSDARAAELFIGCLAAMLVSWGVIRQTKRVRLIIGLTSAASAAAILYAMAKMELYSAFTYSGGFALVALGTAVIIVNALLFPSRLTRLLEFPPLVWMGKVSYGLYLWHFPVFETTRQILGNRNLNPFLYQSVRFGAVLALAAASFYILESPFLRLKQKYSAATHRQPEIPADISLAR
jgi:peptidoglycan/LPS O-acetylase OafA/YrhL